MTPSVSLFTRFAFYANFFSIVIYPTVQIWDRFILRKETIDSVYTDVYDYRKSDLLLKTISNLPDLIDVEELKV